MAKFNERLRSLRAHSSLSQADLGRMLKLSKSSVNMYERGEREPGLATLEKIADYFNVDMDYLLGKSDTPNKAKSADAPSSEFLHNPNARLFSLSDDALKIAAAYDKATAKERMMVQVALSDYIERDFTPVRIAAFSKDGQPIDFTGVDPEAAPELDFVEGPPIP